LRKNARHNKIEMKRSSVSAYQSFVRFGYDDSDAGAVLGRGHFGTVYRGWYTDPQGNLFDAAIKKIQCQNPAEAVCEAELLGGLSHHHIVQCYAYRVRGDILEIAMELCPHGTLGQLISRARRPLREEQIWTILAMITSGLRYLHAHQIAHRDLKPDNILIGDEEHGFLLKISDFGLAKVFPTSTSTRGGDMSYASPQRLAGSPHTAKTDVWSLGCTVYELMERRRPFLGHSLPDFIAAQRKGVVFTEASDIYSEWGQAFRCVVVMQSSQQEARYRLTTREALVRFMLGGTLISCGCNGEAKVL
jgi:serine/threonine protein kinase